MATTDLNIAKLGIKYKLRILVETIQGKKFSYMATERMPDGTITTGSVSQSFFNSDNFPNYAMSSSTAWGKITGSISCSYLNTYTFSSSADQFLTSSLFKHNIYITSSLVGGNESGSMKLITTDMQGVGDERDKLLRFKFFGTKVCNVLGFAENFWYYTDDFILSSGSHNNYFRGDIAAESLTVLGSMNVTNIGSWTSDLPIKLDKSSDRWVRWALHSGSAFPINHLKLGYNSQTEAYELSAEEDEQFEIIGINNMEPEDGILRFTGSIYMSDGTVQAAAGAGGLWYDGYTYWSSSNNIRVDGYISASGDIISFGSSDERLKNNIKVIDKPIEKVSQLRGVQFEWNDNQNTYVCGSLDTGVIAQDVQKVLPELVNKGEDGYLGVKYEKLAGLLIESIKEQQQEINNLKYEIKKLKGD